MIGVFISQFIAAAIPRLIVVAAERKIFVKEDKRAIVVARGEAVGDFAVEL